ncbi:glycosyltransferase [Natronosalvus vescus]|uniref:glycosyltransferase n=1 Tax=Natronosalvus vescus TaxID=2953881 RepID=UPI00209132FC|nr:glycosyltransferase [Natronosalvus vescus]
MNQNEQSDANSEREIRASSDTFSVLISVYKNDDPKHFQIALESIFGQTLVPTEVVIVADGPLTSELDEVIEEFVFRHLETIQVVRLETNQGLGAALRTGLEACSYDRVARMDADDVAVSERFEEQVAYLKSNPDVDVVGSHVGEFRTDPENVDTVRSVPSSASAVESMARFRCPTNHPSVMYRRQAVLEAGNYRPLRSMQDYELWMRMLSQGYTIENLPQVLVKCRAGEDLYRRRGGLSYARLEFSLQREFHRSGMISGVEFIRNIVYRVPIRLIPSRLRGAIYKVALRD